MIENFPTRKSEILKTFILDPNLPVDEQLEIAQKISFNNENVWVEATFPSGAHVGMIDTSTDLKQVSEEFEQRRKQVLQSLGALSSTALSR